MLGHIIPYLDIYFVFYLQIREERMLLNFVVSEMKSIIWQVYMDKAVFTKLYQENYARLLRIAYVYIPNHEDAENIVHDVFVTLWENRSRLFEMDGLPAYLAVMLKNRCLDYLKHQTHVIEHANQITDEYERTMQDRISGLTYYNPASDYDNAVLRKAIVHAIDTLPPRCREVYLLSRQHGLRNVDVAERLGISLNTVEAQITVAHRKLRVALKGYLPQI